MRGTDPRHTFVGHKALSDAGYLHGNINPEHLTVKQDDHTQGVLIGFSNAIDTAEPAKPRILPVSLIGVPIDMLKAKVIAPTYDLELQSFFWCMNYIVENYRGGRLIVSLATAPWHQGSLAEMRKEKISHLDDFVDERKRAFIKFSESLGASHTGLFAFAVRWATGLQLARVIRSEPPSYDTVVDWLQQAIDSYGLPQ